MENHRPNAVPKASTDPLPEIARFLEPFAPLLRRAQSRYSLERYVMGLFALTLDGDRVRSLNARVDSIYLATSRLMTTRLARR